MGPVDFVVIINKLEVFKVSGNDASSTYEAVLLALKLFSNLKANIIKEYKKDPERVFACQDPEVTYNLKTIECYKA